MTVLIYVNTSKQAGDAEHIKAFANADAAQAWLRRTTREVSPSSIRFSTEKRPRSAPLDRK